MENTKLFNLSNYEMTTFGKEEFEEMAKTTSKALIARDVNLADCVFMHQSANGISSSELSFEDASFSEAHLEPTGEEMFSDNENAVPSTDLVCYHNGTKFLVSDGGLTAFKKRAKVEAPSKFLPMLFNETLKNADVTFICREESVKDEDGNETDERVNRIEYVGTRCFAPTTDLLLYKLVEKCENNFPSFDWERGLFTPDFTQLVCAFNTQAQAISSAYGFTATPCLEFTNGNTGRCSTKMRERWELGNGIYFYGKEFGRVHKKGRKDIFDSKEYINLFAEESVKEIFVDFEQIPKRLSKLARLDVNNMFMSDKESEDRVNDLCKEVVNKAFVRNASLTKEKKAELSKTVAKSIDHTDAVSALDVVKAFLSFQDSMSKDMSFDMREKFTHAMSKIVWFDYELTIRNYDIVAGMYQ